MGNRKFSYDGFYGGASQKIGHFASGVCDSHVANNVCYEYANVRRNVIATMYNSSGVITLPGPEESDEYTFVDLPIGDRIERPGYLKVWILYSLSSEAAINAVQMGVGVARFGAFTLLQSASKTWASVTLSMFDVDGYDEALASPDDHLRITLKTAGANTITVYSVCAYQPKLAAATYRLTTGANCKLGTDDYPHSVHALDIIYDNTNAVGNLKLPRANVYSQWYRSFHKLLDSYGGDNDELGQYKLIKRQGVSELKLHMLVPHDGPPKPTIRVQLTGLDNAPVEGETQTSETPLSSTNGYWYEGAANYALTFTWTLTGADITSERELTLKIDGRELTLATTIYIPLICMVETSNSSAITHTVPDPKNTIQGSVIKSSHVNDARDTLDHLYQRGGRCICLSDWRFGDSSDSYSMEFHCHAQRGAFGMRSTYGPPSSVPAGFYNSVISRALLYSSQGSKRLRVKMGYSTTSGSSHVKTIHICTANSIGSASETDDFIDADPVYDPNSDDDNVHEFVLPVDGADGRPETAVEATELNIDSGDYEEHYTGAANPPQVFIQGFVDDWDGPEYIIPQWVVVQEVPLSEDEFP